MLRVLVTNFQSIASAAIEIAGFTAITGTNNSGKSALIRAIRGLLQNSKGTAFIRHGTAKTRVELDFDEDGQKVRWEKGRGARDKPTYFLNGSTDPIHPGQSVPDEVRAMGIHPITAGGREVWPQIAPQFTGQVFLLDQPGSVLAEAVSDVTRVAQLNEALRCVEGDRRRAAADLRVRKGDKVELEGQLQGFDGLCDVIILVEAVEERRQTASRVQAAITGLSGLWERLNVAQGIVESLTGVEVVQVPDLSVAVQILDDLESLEGLRSRHETAQGQVDRLKGISEVADDFDISSADRLLSALQIMVGLKDRRDAAIKRVRELEQGLVTTQEGVEQATAEFHEMLGEMGECPLCGSVQVPGGQA